MRPVWAHDPGECERPPPPKKKKKKKKKNMFSMNK